MISVIIPSLKEGDTLELSLRNLFGQAGNFEIIVADGGSTEGALEVFNRFPGVRLIRAGGGSDKNLLINRYIGDILSKNNRYTGGL